MAKRGNKNGSRKRTPYEDPATPQTRKRLKAGTIARLIDNKRIGAEEVMATQEIERVWCALTSKLFAKAGSYGERMDASDERDWSVSLIAQYKRYRQWADSARKPILAITIDIIIDGRSGREIDIERGWKKGTAVQCLIDGLELYVDMARWGRRHRLTSGAKCA